MNTRRELLKHVAIATAGLSMPCKLMAADRRLNVLILGGTGFLGPHTVRAALERGHDVTLFNRGRTDPDLFNELETIIGDRNTSAIRQLEGRRWDGVIDTSAYFPRSVDMAIDALSQNVERYVLISTTSVYQTWSTPDMNESAAVRRIPDPTIEEFRQPDTYGALKALCEEAAEARLPGRVTNIRPGLIVGPGDETDRFTYWPMRVIKGGEILAPGTGEDFVQYIDARDLGRWIIHCLEQNIVGTFNAHSRARALTMARLLDTCRSVLSSNAELTWVDARFLERHQVSPQVDMPIWLPGGMALSAERAHVEGLTMRPLADTIGETQDWFSSLPPDRRSSLRAGISGEREARVLAAWHAATNR